MTCDFSLGHYRELLQAAKAGGYRWAGFDRAPQAGDLILRHDVDLSLDGALAMAEVEASEGAWSTWFLMTRSVFYNLGSSEGERAIARLRELGHRVAHHAVYPHVDLDDRFDRVVAWHNPDPGVHAGADRGRRQRDGGAVLRSGALPVGLESGLAPRLPARRSSQRAAFEWLQLLTHPEIWAFDGATMRESMESMLDADRAARLEHLRHDRIDLSVSDR